MTGGINVPLLAAIIASGFVVESMIGFGSALISLSIAGLIWPVERIVPIQVAAGLPVSAYFAIRYRNEIATDRLWKSILPVTLLGLMAGILLAGRIPGVVLQVIFAYVMFILVLVQLSKMFMEAKASPLMGFPRDAALFGAGLMHGLYAVGGPLMIVVASREGFSKGTFRATLSALWLVLGLILSTQFALEGRYTAFEIRVIAILLIPVALAIGLGDWLHSRVPEGPFRAVTMGMLVLITGKLMMNTVKL